MTEKGVIKCGHGGGVANVPSQKLVYVSNLRVLIDSDPEFKKITACPIAPPAKPCTQSHGVKKGYSDLLRIDGKRICLSNLQGVTDGPIPETSTYGAVTAGQGFVTEEGQ